MKESLFIAYALYFILLGLFGVLLGFLLGIYRHEHEIDQIYLFFFLLLLHILSTKGFHDLFYLPDSSLAPNTAETFHKFSFEPLPQIESRPFKLILKETEQTTQIPFPILGDPYVTIQVDFIWNEFFEYKFELFQFYQDLNEKVKH